MFFSITFVFINPLTTINVVSSEYGSNVLVISGNFRVITSAMRSSGDHVCI